MAAREVLASGAAGRRSNMMQAQLSLTFALLALAPLHARAGVDRPNVLVILLDDVGIEQLAVYDDVNGWPIGDPYEYARTPNIDRIAEGGVRFTQARANVVCSPTRASIQSGRYGFHTGTGAICWPADVSPTFVEFSRPPAPDELCLPELREFGAYGRGAFGKWHLGIEPQFGGSGDQHPHLVGWPQYAGALYNLNEAPNPGPIDLGGMVLQAGYNHWFRTANGVRTTETEYATVRQRRDCQEWILAHADEPWLAVLAFNACHSPYDWPPDGLHSFPPLWPTGTQVLWDHYRAMLETVDHELGVLFAAIAPELADTLVIFMGDNGSPRPLITSVRDEGQDLGVYDALVDLNRFKQSPYEMGIRVPLLVSGPFVTDTNRTSDALVDAVDVFATLHHLVAPLAPAVEFRSADGISFLDVLRFSAQGTRRWSLSERFHPNGLPVEESELRRAFVVRDGTQLFKLVRRAGHADELYDLTLDPFELADLTPAHPAYARIEHELRKVLATP